ncbi:hypothetical protein [Serinicoccus kebangsaanensis]|uniref:hypothetical protein n=1 Tax=Serinicoccus kebangsaanensis TaxID=2602069 RepID=UPI00124DAB92|nr:hypothetical protein [Serinicoccus kebangsaanensis]
MRDDELKDLLGRATAGAPRDDLTAASWEIGRRRARRQSWTVGSLGAVAGVAAIVGAWSLGGGSTDAFPGPAENGGVDDTAVTSAPPGQELVPYRVVFEVVEGQARPDGPVDEWADVDDVTAQPVEMRVETEDGTATSDHGLSTIGLGGPFTFEPGGGMVTSNGCRTVRWSGVSIEDGLLRPDGIPTAEGGMDEECQTGYPNPEAVMMYEGAVGSDLRATTRSPSLRWESGTLVAEGRLMEGDILQVHVSDSGSGLRVLQLVGVPPEELDSLDDLPSTSAVRPMAGTPESLEGTWYLVDLRGIEPEPVTGPALSFDGEVWSVESCGVRHSASGDLVDGVITIEGDWVVETIAGSTTCPEVPWQDLHTWEAFLEGSPTTLMLDDGRYDGVVLEGELP